MFEMSKMRMPRSRSLLTGSGTPWMPQSRRPVDTLARHEQQVLVHRDVALRRRAEIRLRDRRLRRVRDVTDLEPVVVALDGVLAGEGEVRVGDADEFLRRRRRRHHLHVPGGLRCCPLPRSQPDPPVRRGCGRGHDGCDRRRHDARRRGGWRRRRPATATAFGRRSGGAGRRGLAGCCRRCGSRRGGGGGADAVGADAVGAAAGAAGLAPAGEETEADFGAHATASSTTARDAKTSDLMNTLRSPGDEADLHYRLRCSGAESIFCMRSISVVWSAYMSDANLKMSSSCMAPYEPNSSSTILMAPS